MKKYLLLLILLVTADRARTDDRHQIIQLLDRADFTSVEASGSMKPTFDENYLLITIKKRWLDLKVGDIIVYYHKWPYWFDGVEHHLTCHRIIAISEPNHYILVMKGDNNYRADSDCVTEADYRYSVVGWIQKSALGPGY